MPGCPSNDDSQPIELTDENRAHMKVEATAAALMLLTLYARGWLDGAHGVLADISSKWGFVGVTRVVFCLAQTVAILPVPEDSPLKDATPASIRAKLTRLAGEEMAEHVADQLISFGDQVQSAFKELVAIARKGATDADEDTFNTRFDTITDQDNMMQPLIEGVIMHAAVVFTAAQREGNTFALDQLQAACRAGLDLGKHDEETAKEIADLTALLHLSEDKDR
jgi:hypothetical protein